MSELEDKQIAIEKFFAEAFCAESAEAVLPYDETDFKVSAVIKINTTDRGTFYLGWLEESQ